MRSVGRMCTGMVVSSMPLVLVLMTLVALPAVGVQTTLRVPLDLDNNPGTGCSVELQDPSSSSGTTTFQGAEFTVHASVDALPDPPVTQSAQLEDCPAIGGVPSFSDLASDLEVVTNEGHQGSDAIPVYVLLESLGVSGVVRFAVEVTSESGSSDLLIEDAGQPLSFDLDALVMGLPGLGWTGLLVLGLSLLLLGMCVTGRRAKRVGVACGLLLLLLVGFRGGTAWSQTALMGLFTGDPLFLDDEGDSKYGDPAADLVAVWAVAVGDSLVLRFDVADLQIARCRGTNAVGDPDCDGVCDLDDDASSPDCNSLCDAGEQVGSPDCDSDCATLDAAASPDCNGSCGVNDEAGSTDCDGFCSGSDDPASWDCNGTCDPQEVLTDADCNGGCDVTDASGSPDCDGACLAGDVSGSPDCDGACGSGDEVGGVDCNSVCDPGDLAEGIDCNGSCGISDVIGSPDCDHVCGLSDDGPSPDCDGVCDSPSDDHDGPDCDQFFCTLGDAISAGGFEVGCDQSCDPGDQVGSPDCDGACSVGELLISPDCDGVCGAGDEAGGIDCDGPILLPYYQGFNVDPGFETHDEGDIGGPSDWVIRSLGYDGTNNVLTENTSITCSGSGLTCMSLLHDPTTGAPNGGQVREATTITYGYEGWEQYQVGIWSYVPTPSVSPPFGGVGLSAYRSASEAVPNKDNYYRVSLDSVTNIAYLTAHVDGFVYEIDRIQHMFVHDRWFHLALEVSGTGATQTVSAYYNGRLLMSALDAQLVGGSIGIHDFGQAGLPPMSSAGEHVAFDGLSVVNAGGWELPFDDGFTSDLGLVVSDRYLTHSKPSDWGVVNGALHTSRNSFGSSGLNTNAGTYAWYGGLRWTSYQVSATLRNFDDDRQGLIFRFNDPENYYRCTLNGRSGTNPSHVHLVRYVEGQAPVRQTYNATIDLDVPNGLPYRLTAIANGNTIGCSLAADMDGDGTFETLENGGNPVLTYTDTTANMHQNGAVGFQHWGNAYSYWDDTHVDALPCGNGVCDSVESAASCPEDCSSCGDGVCGGPWEDCPEDCWVCGDGVCQPPQETVSNCAATTSYPMNPPHYPGGLGDCCVTAADCNDGNACTADVCDSSNVCQYTELDNTNSCSDG